MLNTVCNLTVSVEEVLSQSGNGGSNEIIPLKPLQIHTFACHFSLK